MVEIPLNAVRGPSGGVVYKVTYGYAGGWAISVWVQKWAHTSIGRPVPAWVCAHRYRQTVREPDPKRREELKDLHAELFEVAVGVPCRRAS